MLFVLHVFARWQHCCDLLSTHSENYIEIICLFSTHILLMLSAMAYLGGGQRVMASLSFFTLFRVFPLRRCLIACSGVSTISQTGGQRRGQRGAKPRHPCYNVAAQ